MLQQTRQEFLLTSTEHETKYGSKGSGTKGIIESLQEVAQWE